MLKNNIRFQRKLKNLTQQQLADLCGVTKNTISLYEKQKMQPRLDILVRMSIVLVVEMDALVDWRTVERRPNYKAAK